MKKQKKPSNQNTFGSKVQDFLYDNIDYIIMFIVIVIVGLIINWRLNNLFKESDISEDSSNESQVITNNIPKKTVPKTNEEDKSKEKSDKLISVSIPKGSASQTVAEILLESKLIEDKKEFYDYVTEKGMETKLKYGEYEIPENADFDKIIEILTK